MTSAKAASSSLCCTNHCGLDGLLMSLLKERRVGGREGRWVEGGFLSHSISPNRELFHFTLAPTIICKMTLKKNRLSLSQTMLFKINEASFCYLFFLPVLRLFSKEGGPATVLLYIKNKKKYTHSFTSKLSLFSPLFNFSPALQIHTWKEGHLIGPFFYLEVFLKKKSS